MCKLVIFVERVSTVSERAARPKKKEKEDGRLSERKRQLSWLGVLRKSVTFLEVLDWDLYC